MRDNKQKYNFWFIILAAFAISKSTAKYENSINRLLDKLYLNEELSGNRFIDRNNGISKKSLLNESTTASASPNTSKNLAGDRAGTMSRLNEYLGKMILKTSKTFSGPASKLENPPQTPIMFSEAQIPQVNENALLNHSKVENKNTWLTNGTSNANDFTHINTGHSSKKPASNKKNELEKNPTLMESILNPFFLKAFKNNDIAKQKKQTTVSNIDNSSPECAKLDKNQINDYSDKHTLTENTSIKYIINDDLLLVNKRPRLLCSKLLSITDNLESPYYRFKSANARRFKIFSKNLEDGWNRKKVNNKTSVIPHRAKNEEGKLISKPVRLVDMVKSEDTMRTLLNQTLLNFSSQIFSLLQETDPGNGVVGNGTANKFWSNIKKKFIGMNRSNHNNLAYELIRNSNDSKRW